MKRIFVLLTFIAFAATSSAQKGYEYKFKVKGLADTVAYLANFYGNKQYYNDTARVDSKGVFVFKGKKQKPGGIYSIVLPDKKSVFQLVISEDQIHMETSKDNLVGDMKIKTSDENKAFYEYMEKMNTLQPALQNLDEQRKSEEDPEAKAKIKEKIDQYSDELNEFREQFFKKHDGLFITKVLKASKEPEIPDEIKNHEDSTMAYKYYRNNYFKYVDLTDDRMIRTPVLHNKIEYYLTKLTPQVPDSVCAAAKHIIDQTEGDSSLIFKYVVQFVTNKYEKSKMMGMDAVFVCMAEEYYMKGKAFWLDSGQFENISDHYIKRSRQVIGVQAENIVLPDPEGNWKSMYDINSDYIILIFWDPKCGHCKKELPKLKKFYDEWKDKGVEVYAVSTALQNEDWIEFIEEKEIGDWINTSDSPEINKDASEYIRSGKTTLNSLNFRDYWDLYSTPQLYILDKDKKIIAKRLGAEQLSDFLEQHGKQKGTDEEGGHIEMEVMPEQ